MAGTSGTPLDRKLGIKSGHRVVLLNPPVSFQRALPLPADVRVSYTIKATAVDARVAAPIDVVVCFVNDLEELEKRFSLIASRLHPGGGVWVAWRNRARKSGVITDDVVRRIGLAAGMVYNKVCAIDESWSAMRLVMRTDVADAVAYRALPPGTMRRTRKPSAAVRMAARVQSGAGSMMRRARARSTR